MLHKKDFVKYLGCLLFIFVNQISNASVDKDITRREKTFKINTSLPATIENAYQIKENGGIDYLIVCQEIKNPENWNCDIEFLSDSIPATIPDADYPKTLAAKIVQNYGNFYRTQEGVSFAMAAIDLSKIQNLVDNIRNFIGAVNACKRFDYMNITNAVKTARRNVLSFTGVPDYVDLYSFFTRFLAQVNKIKTRNTRYNAAIKNLLDCINDVKNSLQIAVISRVTGEKASGACGLSIFFPMSGAVDPDYSN